MSQDLGTLINNVSRLVTNLDAKDNKYYDVFFDQTPADVVLDKLNADGSTTTVTIPNRAKVVQAFNDWQGAVLPDAQAADLRQKMCSAFVHDLKNVDKYTAALDATSARSDVSKSTLAFVGVGSEHSSMLNSFGFFGNPEPLVDDGYNVKLEGREGKQVSLLFTLPTAPASGTRLDYVFIESWKEEVVVTGGADVVFPYGCVQFDKGDLTTIDSCTLLNTDQSGGEYPLYLASASNHGYYVRIDDANISKFFSNPANGMSIDADGKWWQKRWRVRVVSGVSSDTRLAHDDTTNVKAQGQLAAPSAIAFASVSDDVAVSRASDVSLSLDGSVSAIPIGLINRRNRAAWTLENVNGAYAFGTAANLNVRPDSKFYDCIYAEDCLDLRHHTAYENKFDFKGIYDGMVNKLYNSAIDSTFEELKVDPDGNDTYSSTGIFGCKQMRADIFAGTSTPNSTLQVDWRDTCMNGMSARFDGFRNLYSDLGGEQPMYFRVNNVNADGTTGGFGMGSYTSSTRTIALQNAGLEGGGTTGTRVQWSGRKPKVTWADTGAEAHVVWDAMSGDTISGVIQNVTHAWFAQTQMGGRFARNGDVYQAANGVQFTVSYGVTSDNTYGFGCSFTGATVPSNGTATIISGSGSASIIIALSVLGAKSLGETTSGGGWYEYVGEGSNLHAGQALHVLAFAQYPAGSGAISRIPYNDDAIKGCHYNLNISGTMTQVLPNNGKGFIPTSLLDGNQPNQQSATRSLGMSSFLYKTPVMDIGTEPNGYNSTHSANPCIIKDGSTFKMWFTGYSPSGYRILYSTSPDKINWTVPVLAVDKNTAPSGYSANGIAYSSVIKDGATFKMWTSGLSSSNTWRILYLTSSDGIAWSTPVLAMDINTLNGFNNSHSFIPSVIKDGSTFKMWFTGWYDHPKIGYSTSSDGITWITPVLVMDWKRDVEGASENSAMAPCVIKESSVYKMVFAGASSVERILYSNSMDGVAWSTPIKIIEANILEKANNVITSPCLFKDNSSYCLFFQGLGSNGTAYRIFHAVLAMSDVANTGSSLTGVYATEGTINNAPPANSQVIIHYETPNITLDKLSIKASKKYTIKYIEPKAIVSVAGMSQIIPNSIDTGRNLISYICPWASGSAYVPNEELQFINHPQNSVSDRYIMEVPLTGVKGSLPKNGDSKIAPASMTYYTWTGVDQAFYEELKVFIDKEAAIPMTPSMSFTVFPIVMESEKALTFLIGCDRFYSASTLESFNIVDTRYTDGWNTMLFPTGRPVLK